MEQPVHVSTTRTPTLDIAEVYKSSTFQGEGPSMGRRCTFVRLGRCNLDCGEGEGASWKCDTPFTWRWRGRYQETGDSLVYDRAAEMTSRAAADVVAEVAALGVGLCVVTGGEPLLQRGGLTALCHGLRAAGMDVEVETNGTLEPWPDLVAAVTRFNCSPKLANSGVAEVRRFRPDALRALVGHAAFKFVAARPADLFGVAEVVEAVPLPDRDVWVMPAGTDAETVRTRLAVLAGPVLARGWNLSHRLHVELWGSERGR